MLKNHLSSENKLSFYEKPKCRVLSPIFDNTFTTTISAVSEEQSKCCLDEKRLVAPSAMRYHASTCVARPNIAVSKIVNNATGRNPKTFQARLALAGEVYFENKSGITYLYSHEMQKYLLLDNQVSVEIVSRCDGEKTIIEIANELCAIYEDVETTTVLNDIEEMAVALGNEGFISERYY